MFQAFGSIPILGLDLVKNKGSLRISAAITTPGG
jgi:hypothetical protein